MGNKFKQILASLSRSEALYLEERAAIMEYDGGLTREEAEREAVLQLFPQLEIEYE